MTGLVKSWATPVFGLTVAPALTVIVGDREATLVPNGTVTAIV